MIYFTNGVSHEKILFFFFSTYFYTQNHHPLYHDFRNITRAYLLYSPPDSLNEYMCDVLSTVGTVGHRGIQALLSRQSCFSFIPSFLFLFLPFARLHSAFPVFLPSSQPLNPFWNRISFIHTHSNRTLYLSPWKSFLHPSISLITLGRENMPWKMLRSTITVRIMFFFFPPSPARPSLRSVKSEW